LLEGSAEVFLPLTLPERGNESSILILFHKQDFDKMKSDEEWVFHRLPPRLPSSGLAPRFGCPIDVTLKCSSPIAVPGHFVPLCQDAELKTKPPTDPPCLKLFFEHIEPMVKCLLCGGMINPITHPKTCSPGGCSNLHMSTLMKERKELIRICRCSIEGDPTLFLAILSSALGDPEDLNPSIFAPTNDLPNPSDIREL
jgi:hypothetical protein